MACIGFAITALASLVFAVWFLIAEMESPGLSFAVALIGMPLLLTLFGFSKIKGAGITKDGKGAGWVALVISTLGVGYIAMFFSSWLIIAILWLALHGPMIAWIVASPTSDS